MVVVWYGMVWYGMVYGMVYRKLYMIWHGMMCMIGMPV